MTPREELPIPAPVFERSSSTTDGSRPVVTVQASDCTISEPSSLPVPKAVQIMNHPAKFALGGSCSSSEQNQGIESLKAVPAVSVKNSVLTLTGASWEEESLKNATESPKFASGLTAQKKQASSSSCVMTRTIDEGNQAVNSGIEVEYVDGIAIDDGDDLSDWEDFIEDGGRSSVDEKFFQRIPSKVNLTSKPSLISILIAQNEQARNLGNHVSQSTFANRDDEAPHMVKGMHHPALKSISEIPWSRAQPIDVTVSHVRVQAALSPRSTRRNMLDNELTESLRRNLSWERQQKSLTANAVLKRRHPSRDMVNLKSPEKPCMKNSEGDATLWNHYFSNQILNGYHSTGW